MDNDLQGFAGTVLPVTLVGGRVIYLLASAGAYLVSAIGLNWDAAFFLLRAAKFLPTYQAGFAFVLASVSFG